MQENNGFEKIISAIKNNAILIVALGLVVGLFLFFPPATIVNSNTNSAHESGNVNPDVTIATFSEKAKSEDLYEMISCPCCGSPISKNCCGMAKQRQTYIDGLVDSGNTTNEALHLIAKKYGMESIIDETIKADLRQELIENAPEERPKIKIEPKTYDFGDVSFAGGEVSTKMKIKNDGKTDLVISSMESSCMCTTATITFNGLEGPRFGMASHGKNPKNWSVVIPPGETAELKIYYNPKVHPDLRGPVTRTVSVFSNDPVDFEVKVKITANQVD